MVKSKYAPNTLTAWSYLKTSILWYVSDISTFAELLISGRLCLTLDVGGIVDHHWLEAIVSCVDVGGMVDHHCFNFLFIIYFYIII
jgi:hypothetical protein